MPIPPLRLRPPRTLPSCPAPPSPTLRASTAAPWWASASFPLRDGLVPASTIVLPVCRIIWAAPRVYRPGRRRPQRSSKGTIRRYVRGLPRRHSRLPVRATQDRQPHSPRVRLLQHQTLPPTMDHSIRSLPWRNSTLTRQWKHH